LNTLLNANVTPKVVVYLCDWESFGFLFTTAMKSTFIMKMWFEFGHYMVGTGKVLVFLLSLMKEHVLYYVYLFFRRVEKLVQAYILGSKKLPSIVENLVSTFAKD
jgi:hypothetical protein